MLRLVRLGVVLSICWGLASPVAAQITTGTVTGTVTDVQGGALPGAEAALTNARSGVALPSVQTDATGWFTIANVAPGSYRLRVSFSQFKPLYRTVVVVSPGDRLVLPTLPLQILNPWNSNVDFGDSSVFQESGERPFRVGTPWLDFLANVPARSRGLTEFATLAPGVTMDANGTPTRVGGGGSTNIFIDGVSTNDTGSQRASIPSNLALFDEVRIMTSGHQAEFGRTSGVQVMAVTKRDLNNIFIYDVERDSKWYSNSKTNVLNGDPKAIVRERDWGLSLGGPIRTYKLTLFYAHDVRHRRSGGDVQRFRMPTALERAGDFSQTLDNNGALYNLIKDPLSTLPCTATNTAGCFASGGALGRIPNGRLYRPGLNILRLFPMPTLTDAAALGLAYNYEATRPVEQTWGIQPTLRLDYQPSDGLRGTFKYAGWWQANQVYNGVIQGFDDGKQYRPTIFTMAVTLSYTIKRTLLEVTWGRRKNELTGCALGESGPAPIFCRASMSMSPLSSIAGAELEGLPRLFPDATIVDPSSYHYKAFQSIAPPFWADGRADRIPSFTWGGRVANSPPNVPYPQYLSMNSTNDVSVSVMRAQGRHMLKAGLYVAHAQTVQGPDGQEAVFGRITFTNDANNSLDTTFPFANAAVGVFSAYNQRSRFAEVKMLYKDVEGYLQDSWRISNRMTLDYGVRLVNQQPAYDDRLAASKFLAGDYSISQAPAFYTAACTNGAVACGGAMRVARDPLTGILLPAGSAVSIGTRVPTTGNPLNGISLAGQGAKETLYTSPTLGFSPRFSFAFSPTGERDYVVQGGVGVYFERPNTDAAVSQTVNPPWASDVTLKTATLEGLSNPSITVFGAPRLASFERRLGLPSSAQWHLGAQFLLPWLDWSVLDLAYAGQHAWNQQIGVNINAVDFGAAYLSANQDATLTGTNPGGNAQPNDLLRGFRGYSNITQQWDYGSHTSHSVLVSLQRRYGMYSGGITLGLDDAITLQNITKTAPRLDHMADGSFRTRDDQTAADALLQVDPVRHVVKGYFVWDLPDVFDFDDGGDPVKRTLAAMINGWRFSGIWRGTSAAPYTVGYRYQDGLGNINLTGSPDYAARIALTGDDPGSGCSSDPIRQFNAAAFAAPLPNSVGLESSPNVVKGCFQSAFDLSIARTFELDDRRTLQVRLDLFNALNQATVTGRNSTMEVASLATNTVATNLPFGADGSVSAAKSLPKNAGFGVATAYQSPRTMQLQVRFGF